MNPATIPKKGQVTIFMILGLLLLIFLIIAVVLSSQVKQAAVQEAAPSIASSAPVKSVIEQCLEQTASSVLQQIAWRGGYLDVPTALQYKNASLWFVQQVNVQPTFEAVHQRVKEAIDQRLESCLDFQSFTAQGLRISHQGWQSTVDFGRANTKVTLQFTIDIASDQFSTHYEQFSVVLPVAFREQFELASTIINLQLAPDFQRLAPLQHLPETSLEVRYALEREDTFLYSISQKAGNEAYVFRFASKLGRSTLKRMELLPEKSHQVPSLLPRIVESLDKMAKLLIVPGTTTHLWGEPVSTITVQQDYSSVISREVPLVEYANNSITSGNISWLLTYPVYNFEPTGLRFNQPQRLFLYWDEDEIPHQGEMGILYTEGDGWRPLPTAVNYTANVVYTDIPGFSSFTPVDCGVQYYKTAETTAEFDPGAGCWGMLIVKIIIIIVTIVLIIVTFGGATPLVAGEAAVLGGGTAATSGAGGAIVTATTATTITATSATGLTSTFAVAAGSSASIAAGTTFTVSVAATVTAVGEGVLIGVGAGTLLTAAGVTATFGETLLAAITAGFSGALTALGTGLVIGGGIIGGLFLNAALGFSAAQDTITFTPTCDQDITVDVFTDSGEGICSLEEGQHPVQGGEPVTLQAQVQKCNFGASMFCVPCSVTCRGSYK